MQTALTTPRLVSVATRVQPARSTRVLLACGVASAPFFYVVAIAQVLTRPGFDIRHHAISLLSLGDLGWIQVANFAITGLLALACAAGMRRAIGGGRAGTWGPILVGLYGAGLLTGAGFHPDPGLGFPPGAPAGMPATMSAHAAVHMAAFFLGFVATIAACFVLARHFAAAGLRRWVAYCVGTGAVTPVLIVLGSSIRDSVGVIFAVAGLVAFGWVSVIAGHLWRHIDDDGR